ncbi:MAG: septum formation initiator family protein [bacterium]
MNKEIRRSALKRKKIRSLDSRPYRIAYSMIVFALLIYVTAYLVNLNYQNSIGLERGIHAVKAEQREKFERIKNLKEEKIKLHNIEYLKEIARKELYLMPPREVYIKIVPNPVNSNEGR